MKRICTLLVTALFLFANGYAQFDSCCCDDSYYADCCDNQGCGCCFGIAGEWLYMLFAIDQPYYCVERGTTGSLFNGDRVANKQHWHSGGRVELTYCLPCCDYLRARWTGFNNVRDSDTTDVANFAILEHPGAASAQVTNTNANVRHRINFNYVDVFYGRAVYCCCPVGIALEAGIQYIDVHWREKARYGTTVDVRNHSHVRGVGPELGLRFDYRFGNCFAIVSRTTTAFVLSHKHTDFRHTEGATLIADTSNEDFWFATPTIDTRIGFNFNSRLNCFCWNLCYELEVGYEFIHVHKGVDRIYFVDNVAVGQSFTEHMDLTFHGPYFRAGVCF